MRPFIANNRHHGSAEIVATETKTLSVSLIGYGDWMIAAFED
jgi:hypothetical protein